MKNKILLVENSERERNAFISALNDYFQVISIPNGLKAFEVIQNGEKPEAIVSELSLPGVDGRQLLHAVRENRETHNLPFIIVSDQLPFRELKKLLSEGADDFFPKPVDYNELSRRIQSLINLKKRKLGNNGDVKNKTESFKMPLKKRLFDILVSGTALLLLSPLFLVVAILIKLTSKGPVFYVSKRVGTGYKIFDLYKFRTMHVDADKQIDEVKKMNLYNDSLDGDSKVLFNSRCPKCQKLKRPCSPLLYNDGEIICEDFYSKLKQKEEGGVFIKIKDDPRVTWIGKFLRNTSVDELPQLINILKGDMSLVGNRPLPLYEAEKLTTDEWTERFLAPAGLTGLWQVTKRGKSDMSTEERINLDNVYARNCSFWNDLKILLKTIPAVFQSESV